MGRDEWAVHIGLWRRDGDLCGAVAVPDRRLLLTSEQPAQRPVYERRPDTLRVAVSRRRTSAVVTRVCSELGAELIPAGSVGVKVALVIVGVADAYLHSGGQYEWDSAAPVA